MDMIRTFTFRHLFVTLCLLPWAGVSFADRGHPVAVSVEPNGWTIETMGGLRVAIDSNDTPKITIGELSDVQTNAFRKTHQLSPGAEQETSWLVHRQHNQMQSTCEQGVFSEPISGNAVLLHRRKFGDQGQLATWIQIDGVVILDLGSDWREDTIVADDTPCDVIVATQCASTDGELVKRLSEKLTPQFVLIADNTNAIDGPEIVTVKNRNVIAVAAKEEKGATQWIKLSDQRWKMPSDELGALFEQKEKSCAQSRAVFSSLSIEQMNFVPDDGSHTPRWNTEHMMGRELLFFSQIYHSIDPSIPVMNLNPKQMPKNYIAAHRDWTGHEEALLTLQVEAFSRRFAYLMADLPLDEKTRGSKMWSPRGLLEQMNRHYHQHTENVKKKMKLKNWPKR